MQLVVLAEPTWDGVDGYERCVAGVAPGGYMIDVVIRGSGAGTSDPGPVGGLALEMYTHGSGRG